MEFCETTLANGLQVIAECDGHAQSTALGFFVTPALVGSPQELMIASLVSQQVRETLDWPFAAALIGVLMLVVTGLTLVFNKAINFNRMIGGGA